MQREEFLKSFDAYAEAIYRHCFFRVFSRMEAEDLVQDTYTKTWRYIAAGKRIENMRAFLYQVANNLIIDRSRKNREESLEALIEKAGDAAEPSSDNHREMEKSALMKNVHTYLAKLLPEQREIIVFRFIDDLDPKEIGAILGITANTASVRLNRAVTALKSLINPE